jgi:hypothetical protein
VGRLTAGTLRPVRRWLIPILAASLFVAASPAKADFQHRCAVKGSETVRGSDKVRVYSKDGVLYGCVRSSGVTRKLYEPGTFIPNEYSFAHHVRIAGYHVAHVVSSACTVCGDGGPFATLHEVELRSGRHRRLDHVRNRPRDKGTGIDALVIDRCGRIAYRAVLDSVYAHDQTDPDPELHTWVGKVRRRIDRGAIRRDSIRLEPGSVRWVNGGVERSAPLAPTC